MLAVFYGMKKCLSLWIVFSELDSQSWHGRLGGEGDRSQPEGSRIYTIDDCGVRWTEGVNVSYVCTVHSACMSRVIFPGTNNCNFEV